MSCRVARAFLCLLAVVVCNPAYAGTVYLKDGSVVHGDITSLADADLTVVTSFAGEITIDAGALRGITTDDPVTITLDNGDEVAGRLLYKPGEGQRIADTALGTTTMEAARIVAVRPAGAPDPELVALKEKLASQRSDLWQSQILLGLGGTSGNSESSTVSFGANATRAKNADRLFLSLLVNKAKQDGEETSDETIGTVRLEHDFSERFFVFGQTELEHDEFENLDLRSTTIIGPGYFFIREEGQELKGRLGFGYEYISPVVGDDQSEAVASLGYDYFVNVFDWFRFSHILTYVPQITDSPGENFRIESILGLEAPLGASQWSLLAQYRHDYNNSPEVPEIEELDTTYQLNLVRDFE